MTGRPGHRIPDGRLPAQAIGNPAARVAKNSAVVLAAKIIEMSSSLITMMVLARILAPHRYGDFALLNAIVLAFQPLINLEINTILIREMASNRERERELLGGGILLKALLVAVFLISAVCLDRIMMFDPVLRTAFFLAVIAEVFQQVVWVYSAVFMARERMEFEPLLSLISRILSVGGVLCIALLHPRETMETRGFVLIFLLIAVSQAVRAVLGVIIAAGFLKSFRISWSFKTARDLFGKTWIMGLATFCTGLTLRIDVFFLKHFGSSEDVALFHIPHMYTLQIQILAISVVTALFPVLSRWGGRQSDSLKLRTAQDLSIRLMTVSGLLLAAGSALFPGEIIRILAGTGYSGAMPALRILAWCIPILFLNYLGANLLTVIQKQNWLFAGAFISLLINGGLDYLWIPRYGIIGASAATVMAYGVQVIIVLRLLRVHGGHPVHSWKAIGFPAMITLAVTLPVHYLGQGRGTAGFAGVRVLTFIALSAVLLMIQPPDVKEAVRRIRGRKSDLIP